MRLVLYNIRYGTGVGKQINLPWGRYLRRTSRNLEQIVFFLKSLKPDIIGLVEVDKGSFRTGRVNQAEIIAAELGHYHCHETKYSITSLARRLPLISHQANAFLTRRRISNRNFHYFRKGMKRLVIELELEDLNIFLVHLSLKFRTRQTQLCDLYSLVQTANKPVIVAGDFNAFWGDNEIKLFMAATGLCNASPNGAPSFPSWAPKRQLDFILHSPEISITRFEIPAVKLSDHLPLVCDFCISPAAKIGVAEPLFKKRKPRI